MTHTRSLGQQGEQLVATWLIDRGFKVLTRNYRIPLGEIDLIALRDEVLAFVEVKTRRTSYFHLSQVITKTKQRRIIKAAKHYLLKNKVIDKVCRFDVAFVIADHGEYEVEYVPDAFRIE